MSFFSRRPKEIEYNIGLCYRNLHYSIVYACYICVLVEEGGKASLRWTKIKENKELEVMKLGYSTKSIFDMYKISLTKFDWEKPYSLLTNNCWGFAMKIYNKMVKLRNLRASSIPVESSSVKKVLVKELVERYIKKDLDVFAKLACSFKDLSVDEKISYSKEKAKEREKGKKGKGKEKEKEKEKEKGKKEEKDKEKLKKREGSTDSLTDDPLTDEPLNLLEIEKDIEFLGKISKVRQLRQKFEKVEKGEDED